MELKPRMDIKSKSEDEVILMARDLLKRRN
jgi:hypothetical protein